MDDAIGEDADLAARGMSVQEREVALTQAVAEGRWHHAVVLVQYGVTSSQRDATVLRAAESQQWGCVGKLLDLGVSSEKRDSVFSIVAGGGDVRLSSQLITAGVSRDLLEEVLNDAMQQGRASFVLELLRLTTKISVSDFVLTRAMDLQDWTLLFEMVKQHKELQLSGQQMDTVGKLAVSARQWDCALFLFEQGVTPAQGAVTLALKSGPGVMDRFLEIFQRVELPSRLKERLINSAIEVGCMHTLRYLLRRYGASNREAVQGFHRAVGRSREALEVLVSGENRNSKRLKSFCATLFNIYPDHQERVTEAVVWICVALKDSHIVLCLDLALLYSNQVFLSLLLRNETSKKVRRMFLHKVCASREALFLAAAQELVARQPDQRRRLFLMAVRRGRHSTAVRLYGQGVSLRDVRFAISVAFASTCLDMHSLFLCGDNHCTHILAKKSIVQDFTLKLNREDSSKLLKGLVRESRDHVVSTGEEEAEFVTWFKLYCARDDAEHSVVARVFKRVYKVAVARGRVNCFVESVSLVMRFSRKEKSRVAHALFGRDAVAYNDYMSQDNTSKADAAIDFAVNNQKLSFLSQSILANKGRDFNAYVLKRLFSKGVWPLFDTLFESKDGGSQIQPPVVTDLVSTYGQVFIHCLSITVVKASVTQGVGASDRPTVGAVRVMDKWLCCMCPNLKYRRTAGCVLNQALSPDWRLSQRSGAVLRLAELSFRHGCHRLALFLAMMLGADGSELMERVVSSQSHLHAVGINLVFELACYARRSLQKPAVAAALIKNLPLSVLSPGHNSVRHADPPVGGHDLNYLSSEIQRLCPTDPSSSQQLIAALRQTNAFRWVLLCQLVAQDFAQAEKTLTLCDPQESACVDVVVEYATAFSRWDLVGRYVSEACHPDVLLALVGVVLACNDDMGAGVAQRLLNLTGTCPQAQRVQMFNRPYLYDLVCEDLPHKRQRAVDLLCCLVGLGASAQQRRVEVADTGHCPLRRAGSCRQLHLVYLFHRSGACSNRRLFQLAAASHGSAFWDMLHVERGNVDQEVIRSYLAFAAGCPLSLQDLCRHAVSSSLGGRPGYLQRVQALPIPELIQEFILFPDITPEVKTWRTE